jgi:uncharacterized membrane protein YqjE
VVPPGAGYMDKLSKARIFGVVMFTMLALMLAFFLGLAGLYILVTKYLGMPFPVSLYRLLYAGGFGGIAGWALSTFRRRTSTSDAEG